MSVLWDKLIECQHEIINIFKENGTEIAEPGLDHFNQPENGWINRVWANDHIRRAHIDVVDARDTKKLWMMHVCVFPTLNNDAPIYGFDVIAGARKITGAFHDFSPSSGGYDHDMIKWYENTVKDFVPTRERELPEWARNIFTDSMIAASMITTEEEISTIIGFALDNLREYFKQVPNYAGAGDRDQTIAAQNWYCDNQQKNPHTPNVMKSLGLNEQDVEKFCTDMLFPNII